MIGMQAISGAVDRSESGSRPDAVHSALPSRTTSRAIESATIIASGLPGGTTQAGSRPSASVGRNQPTLDAPECCRASSRVVAMTSRSECEESSRRLAW
jgi:hypothetical protein